MTVESELREHSPQLYSVEDTCNAYAVIDGDAALVIDPGSGAIVEALGEIGINEVEWVFHTHHHRDQCWGVYDLVGAGAKVAVPEHERHLFDDVETFWAGKRLYDNYNDRATFDTLPRSVPVDETLDDYESFKWGPYSFDVLPAKGHTFGSSAFLTTIDGRDVAFTGDLLSAGGTLPQLHAMEYEYSDMKGVPFTIQSIQALARHEPDVLYPSHGAVIADPMRDIERLERRLMDIVDLGPRIQAGTRAYLPEMRMLPVSPHLLWSGPWTCSNFYVVKSETGKALFVDYGHSLVEHMHVGLDREDLETMRFVEHHLDDLTRRHGIDEFDIVIPSHIHDDHTVGIPHLQRHYDVDCWALEEVADVLADPAAWSSTPCTLSTPIDIDRRFEDGDTFTWEEYEFDIYQLPGQTEFHSAIAGEIDGWTVAFTGDSFRPGDVDVHYDRREERPFVPTVFRNSFQFQMHRRCKEVMRTISPDRICRGHGNVLEVDDRDIQEYCDFIDRKEEVFRAVTRSPAEQHVDLFWARLLPYQARAPRGATVRYDLLVRNNFERALPYEAELLGPDGQSNLGSGSTTLSPGESERIPIEIEVGDWEAGRNVVTGTIAIDGDSKGPVVEAIVDVED